MATRFQQLGAFVADWRGMSDQQLKAFHDCGGRWLVPLVAQLGYPDDHDEAAAWNLANIKGIIEACAEKGIACGGWFNGWAKNAYADAQQVADIMRAHPFTGPVVLDCEAAYQYPIGDWNQLPVLISQVRRHLTTRGILVSTNSPNDSMIWNGGALGYTRSCWSLGVRVAPQWYNAPAYGNGIWMRPDLTMQYLKEHGDEGNLYVPNRPDHRAVPLSYWHGTLEVTGLEGATLPEELSYLRAARRFGYTVGFSIYTLENAPASDFKELAAERGKLFLV